MIAKFRNVGAPLLLFIFVVAPCFAQPTDLVEKANAGDVEVQRRLGDMHRRGDGAPQDNSKAVMWYRRAAEQGNTVAQINLGIAYINGIGIQKDLVMAHAVTTIAANAQDPKSSKIASTNKMHFERQMTKSQISESNAISSNWKVGQSFERPDAKHNAKPELPSQANNSSNNENQILGLGDLKLGMSEKDFLALPQTKYNQQQRIQGIQNKNFPEGVNVHYSTLDIGVNNSYFSGRHYVDLYFFNDELVRIVVDTTLTPRERIGEALTLKYGKPNTKDETRKDVCVNNQGNLMDWKIGRVTGEWRAGETRGILFNEYSNCAIKEATYTAENIKKSEQMQKIIDSKRNQNIIRNSAL